MITAREALALPTAQVSESDRQAAEKIVEEVDAAVRAGMNRSGASITLPLGRLNPAILAEVIHTCRREGWAVGVQDVTEQSRVGVIAPRVGTVVTGHKIIVQPTDESYDRYDAEVKWAAVSEKALS